MTRYWYDVQSQQCRSFAYTGVGGNENNFLTLEDCQQACVKRPRSSAEVSGMLSLTLDFTGAYLIVGISQR